MAQDIWFQPVEGAAWITLRVICIALLCLVIHRLMSRYSLPLPHLLRHFRKQNNSTEATRPKKDKDRILHSDSDWASMGTVTPLQDLDYRNVKPLRIYKFSPKYFLTMGLKKTDINEITHIDSLYLERIKARQDIIHQYPGAIDCLDSGLSALNELYDFFMQDYLPHRYPTIFQIDPCGKNVRNMVTDEVLPCTASRNRYETLQRINRNVDEDFLMMLPSPDGDGYTLQSFVWAYPVGFDPQSKKGIKLRDAHKPVPGYKEKLQMSMDRYFSKLEPGDVKCRVSWAVASSDNLCERGEYHLAPGQEPTEKEFSLEACRVRCELQTVFSLPKSGARILSVHLYLYRLQEIKDVGLGPAMVEAIDGLKNGNVPGFHLYKRAILWGEQVKTFLLDK